MLIYLRKFVTLHLYYLWCTEGGLGSLIDSELTCFIFTVLVSRMGVF